MEGAAINDVAIHYAFNTDLNSKARAVLIREGFAAANDRIKVPDHAVVAYYFSLCYRFISQRPRMVLKSSLFTQTMPPNSALKVDALLMHIRRGHDLRGFQTRQLTKKRKLLSVDRILNAWGIQHLHLTKGGGDHVLLCHVTPDKLYAIGFWKHRDWYNEQIIGTLIDTWPEEFHKYRMGKVPSGRLKESHQVNLRAKNVNYAYEHSDGYAYMVAAPVMGSGVSSDAVRRADMLSAWVKAIEDEVRRQFSTYDLGKTSRIFLEFDDQLNPVSVCDPDDGTRAKLNFASAA